MLVNKTDFIGAAKYMADFSFLLIGKFGLGWFCDEVITTNENFRWKSSNPREGLLLLVWEVQGSSGGWDECFREGEETQLHLFKTCNWLMWQKLTRSQFLFVFPLSFPSNLMMTVIGGQVCCLRHYPPVRPPSWSPSSWSLISDLYRGHYPGQHLDLGAQGKSQSK